MTRAGVTTVGHILDCNPDVAEHLLKEQIDVDALKLQPQQQLGVLDEVTVKETVKTSDSSQALILELASLFTFSARPFCPF